MGNCSCGLKIVKRAAAKSAAEGARTKQILTLHIKTLMPGNQSFNPMLYALLTHVPLVSRPAVYFKRKVYMNRRPIVRGILSAGVIFQLVLILSAAPVRAQSAGDVTTADPIDPLGVRQPEFLKPDEETKPEKRVLSADHAPGDIHGVIR
jgi:hypothetical protein